MNPYLDKLTDSYSYNPNQPTLQIIFFDGEEAFGEWTNTDSLYGSRHLANEWSIQTLKSEPVLKSMDVFILLDLIGMKDMKFYNTNPLTSWVWDRFVSIQDRLFELKLSKRGDYFHDGMNSFSYNQIDDDHRPFKNKGVSTVHVIPQPFPYVWHTKNDDANVIHVDSVHDLALLFRVFVAEYLGVAYD